MFSSSLCQLTNTHTYIYVSAHLICSIKRPYCWWVFWKRSPPPSLSHTRTYSRSHTNIPTRRVHYLSLSHAHAHAQRYTNIPYSTYPHTILTPIYTWCIIDTLQSIHDPYRIHTYIYTYIHSAIISSSSIAPITHATHTHTHTHKHTERERYTHDVIVPASSAHGCGAHFTLTFAATVFSSAMVTVSTNSVVSLTDLQYCARAGPAQVRARMMVMVMGMMVMVRVRVMGWGWGRQ